MTDTTLLDIWAGALLGSFVLWCLVGVGTERGMAALRVISPRMMAFTVCGLMLLLLSITLTTTFEGQRDAAVKILAWVSTAVPISMSMTFALVVMTLFENRHKFMALIRGNSPDRSRVS